MDLNLIAGVCLQDSFAIPLTTVSDSRCKNGLCRNVILRRSRRISSSYALEKARCFALLSMTSTAIRLMRHNLKKAPIRGSLGLRARPAVAHQPTVHPG